MAIVIEDEQRERLAEQIAVAEGVSVTEVVRESLLSLAGLRGVAARKPPLRENASRHWRARWMPSRRGVPPTPGAITTSWATTSTGYGD